MMSEFCLIGASLDFPKIKLHFTFSSCACLKYATAPYTLFEASAKTCNWRLCSFVKSISHHLGISVDGKSCDDFFHSSQHCFNSDGNSSSQSTLSHHNSWMINFGSSMAGAIIPRGSNIELMKLRIPLFDTGKFLSTALICKTSFYESHSNPSARSIGKSFSSKSTTFDDISLFGNKSISQSLDIHLCI